MAGWSCCRGTDPEVSASSVSARVVIHGSVSGDKEQTDFPEFPCSPTRNPWHCWYLAIFLLFCSVWAWSWWCAEPGNFSDLSLGSSPGPELHTNPLWLSDFLPWRMSSFTFPPDATVNILVEAQDAKYISGDTSPWTLLIVFLTNKRVLAGEHNFSGFFCFLKPRIFRWFYYLQD